MLIVYHFMLSAGHALKTIYNFLTQNQILIPPKIVRCGKIVGFQQHSNLYYIIIPIETRLSTFL